MSAEANSRPLLLGHRGCRLRGFHENFHSAYAHALKEGCDGFEFDVRLTSDQRPVCIHNPAVGNLDVSTSSYEQLSIQYIKNHRPKESESSEAFPCLPDVLEAYQRTAFLDIELKVPGLEKFTLQLLKRYPIRRGYVISSFLPEVVCELAELAPTELGSPASIGFIFDLVAGLKAWPNFPCSWVIPSRKLVTQDLVNAVHDAGRKLMTWTVNDPEEMERFAGWGVDALVSDDPGLLSRTVRGL